jgi:hypothetical protein
MAEHMSVSRRRRVAHETPDWRGRCAAQAQRDRAATIRQPPPNAPLNVAASASIEHAAAADVAPPGSKAKTAESVFRQSSSHAAQRSFTPSPQLRPAAPRALFSMAARHRCRGVAPPVDGERQRQRVYGSGGTEPSAQYAMSPPPPCFRCYRRAAIMFTRRLLIPRFRRMIWNKSAPAHAACCRRRQRRRRL